MSSIILLAIYFSQLIVIIVTGVSLKLMTNRPAKERLGHGKQQKVYL